MIHPSLSPHFSFDCIFSYTENQLGSPQRRYGERVKIKNKPITQKKASTSIVVMASEVNVYAGNMDFIALTDQIKWMELKTNTRRDDMPDG